MRTAIGLWVGNEVSRRWRTLITLGVLAGLAGGLTLAAVAGARRTSTAYERFREATGRSDAVVFGTLIGVLDADYGPVRRLPEVEDAGEFTLTPIDLEGLDAGQLAPNDDRLYRTINRPLLVAGRLPDPGRADELVVNRKAASELGLGVGDRVTLVAGLDLFGTGESGAGPSVEATVVGVGDSAMELLFSDDSPGFIPSAAFLADHREVPRAGNLVVRLRPGTDVAAFGLRAAEAMGLPNLPVRDQGEDAKRVTHGTDLERTALLIFAVAVGLAGVVLVGQALSRTVYGIAEGSSALRALGFTRPELAAGLVLPLVATAVTAMLAAAGTAVLLSRWFPVGLAGRLEPDRGIDADWLVVGPGAVGVAVVALAAAAVAALRATAPGRRRTAVATGSRLASALGRVAPLPAVIGVGLALRRGQGEQALPVRPAIASGVAAVLGVVGAFGLLQGIDDALVSPEHAGQIWDAELIGNQGDRPVSDVPPELEADVGVAEISALDRTDVELEGAGVPIYALTPVRGAWSFTLLEGRKPAAADEVVMGPASANVRALPTALAVFLVLLGIGALGHVLTSTVRRRRRDLVVLRALGFRPRQVAGCVSWQAITVSLVALVMGIPLGIAAGRWSWRWVADSTPLFYSPPLAATVAVVSVPAALLLANAMAALPARRAARLRPADVLRAE